MTGRPASRPVPYADPVVRSAPAGVKAGLPLRLSSNRGPMFSISCCQGDPVHFDTADPTATLLDSAVPRLERAGKGELPLMRPPATLYTAARAVQTLLFPLRESTIPSYPSTPLIVFDGTESVCGRSLWTVSSLYWSLEWLDTVAVTFIDVVNPNVVIALKTFMYDTGVSLTWTSGDTTEVLSKASLYAGIAFGSAQHMRLAKAHHHGVPVVLALQYPRAEWLTASTLLHEDVAFDPRRFAGHVGAVARMLAR